MAQSARPCATRIYNAPGDAVLSPTMTVHLLVKHLTEHFRALLFSAILKSTMTRTAEFQTKCPGHLPAIQHPPVFPGNLLFDGALHRTRKDSPRVGLDLKMIANTRVVFFPLQDL
jgi:hypothetical protein